MSGLFNRDRNRLLALEQELQARRSSMKWPKPAHRPKSPTDQQAAHRPAADSPRSFSVLAEKLAMQPTARLRDQSSAPASNQWQNLAARLTHQNTAFATAASALPSSRRRRHHFRHPPSSLDAPSKISSSPRLTRPTRPRPMPEPAFPEDLNKVEAPEAADIVNETQSWQSLAALLQNAHSSNNDPSDSI